MSRMIYYLSIIAVSLTMMNADMAQGKVYTNLVATTFDDPNWVLVTSDGILREDICTYGWYEKVFNPCYPDLNLNKYWRLKPYEIEGRAFPMEELSGTDWTFDSLYVRKGFKFQLYYNAEEPNDPNGLLSASPRMAGPRYVSLTWWRDTVPPPEGFEPETFFVPGAQGELGNYSIIIYAHSRCQIVNGSFEDNKWINDITEKDPNGWDVNVPADKFGGYVKQDWPTNGAFNLTLKSERWMVSDINDMATVSQPVYLTDANKITFDLRLRTYPPANPYPWDPEKCTAVVLIDNNAVWESNSVGPDVRGEYRNQFYTIEDKYKDYQLHLLSLGIRINVAETLSISYITDWDNIKCGICCGGGGLLATDFSHDCCVNFADFAILANHWLEENPPWPYDLVENGIVDTNDLEVFVDSWLDCSYIEGP